MRPGVCVRERERGSFCELHFCIFIHVCEGETAKPGANYTQSIYLHFLQLVVGVFPCNFHVPIWATVGGEPNFPNIETKPGAGHLQIGADTLGVHRLCWLPLTATCTCRADGWVERHETSTCGRAALSNVPPLERKIAAL